MCMVKRGDENDKYEKNGVQKRKTRALYVDVRICRQKNRRKEKKTNAKQKMRKGSSM